jgi:hypothetical protein
LERLIRHKSNFREGQVMMMKRFGKSLMIASLALLAQASVVSVGMAQEESPVYGVTRFAQYQGRYAVSFPITNFGQPRINTRANEMSADADIDGAGYFVICLDLHDIGPVEKFLDDLETYAARANHARVVRKAPITLGAFPGREVELENEKGWQRIVRDYLVGNRIYCVGAQARDRKLNRAMVKDFIDSFSLLEGNAPSPTVMPAPAPVPAPSAGTRPIPAPQASAPQWLQWNELARPAVPAPPVPVPAADRRNVNRDGRYSVDFPQTPTETTGTDANGLTVNQAILTHQGVCYGVTYCDLQKQDLDWARTQPAGMAAFQTVWKDSVVRQQGGTVVSEKSVDVAGHAGYQVEFALRQGVHLVGRMVVIGGRCYRIAVWGIDLTSDNPSVNRFMNSFGTVE